MKEGETDTGLGSNQNILEVGKERPMRQNLEIKMR